MPAEGVLLVNLGTPDEPTPAAVRRYLREFLWDPYVVQIPRLPWWFILNFLILPLRPGKVAKKYQSVWREDGAPLRVYTERQAQLLRGYLGEKLKRPVPVAAAMRYGNPSIAAGLDELIAKGCARIFVLPLYPQYAASTTKSTEEALKRELLKRKNPPTIDVLRDFHDHPAYAKAVARNVNDYWMKHGRPDRLLMSFHGLPKVVAAKEPYEKQCRRSAELIATELGWNDKRTLVCFQSRFGRAEWLQPYTFDTLEALGREKTGRVDVICPGFPADCLESLEEIAMEGRKEFLAAGGKDFHYIPTLNDTPAWMAALTTIALEKL